MGPGFDVYGNNRLFVSHDQRLFAEMLPKGSIASYIRGYVNFIGPNVFLPWDTHKRHLNYDREIIEVLRSHPAIKEMFENWKAVFAQVSSLGPGQFSKVINVPMQTLVDVKKRDLAIPHSSDVVISPERKRKVKLPANTFKPTLGQVSAKKGNNSLSINVSLTSDEARELASRFQIQGSVDAPETKRALGEKAKEHLLSLITKSAKK
jgi:hypothetical protein